MYVDCYDFIFVTETWLHAEINSGLHSILNRLSIAAIVRAILSTAEFVLLSVKNGLSLLLILMINILI